MRARGKINHPIFKKRNTTFDQTERAFKIVHWYYLAISFSNFKEENAKKEGEPDSTLKPQIQTPVPECPNRSQVRTLRKSLENKIFGNKFMINNYQISHPNLNFSHLLFCF